MPFADNVNFFKGRGAQINTGNRFSELDYIAEHIEGLDEELYSDSKTQLFEETPKKIISESRSPDISFLYSINPYQGCEHGCLYCYARNSHEYWGFSAGLDFERKIVVKRNAAQLLERQINSPNYNPSVIMLSGNTDCYQPIERKLKITRSLLEIFLKYRHPVSLISKNNLIIRDLDLLTELAKRNLVHVAVTINSLNEDLRQKMEPRTVTAQNRLTVIKKLSEAGVPTRLMMAPIVPGLNSDEIPDLVKAAAINGVLDASYTIVRLNGSVAEIFIDWINKTFPDKAEKVLNAIASCHHGKLNDSTWGRRIRGHGVFADSINQLFKVSVRRYLEGRQMPPFDFSQFVPAGGKQLGLF